MAVTIVIPVKPLNEAKSRLASVLGFEARRELVTDMLGNVLAAAQQSKASRILVVTRDPVVGAMVSAAGVDWIPDPAPTLNGTLLDVFQKCWVNEEIPLYLPADLLRLRASEIDGILDVQDRVVLSPCHKAQGTNALLVPATCALEPQLGEGSFSRHLKTAASAGVATKVYRAPGLAFDIDTPEDLLIHRYTARSSQVHAH